MIRPYLYKIPEKRTLKRYIPFASYQLRTNTHFNKKHGFLPSTNHLFPMLDYAKQRQLINDPCEYIFRRLRASLLHELTVSTEFY